MGLSVAGYRYVLLGDEILVDFEAYLSGRANDEPDVFMQGTVENLGSSPSVVWDIAPTTTSVSIANVPGDIEVGETPTVSENWDLVFEVDNPAYFVDVVKLKITHAPTHTLVFAADYLPMPS